MKVIYNTEMDVLRIVLRDGPITESDENHEGVIIDYGLDGDVIGIEILDASQKVGNPRLIEYQITGDQLTRQQLSSTD